MKRIAAFLVMSLCGILLASGQETAGYNPWKFRPGFSIQTDIHFSSDPHVEQKCSGMTWVDGNLRNDYLDFGLRLEEMNHPLPGREAEKGWGIPHFHVKGNWKGFELTLGDVYEQFGSGLLLYLYEDRQLGLDNAVRGAGLRVDAIPGVHFKVLGGQQRKHFDRDWHFYQAGRGFLWGGDAECTLGQWIPALEQNGSMVNLGLSFLSKHERPGDIIRFDENGFYKLNQPENVGALASRIQVRFHDWDFYTEYACKWDDPNATNGYTFRPGSVWMTTLSYSRKGLSALLGARRSDNFDFRSARDENRNDLKINYLHPFTQQQTYSLAAMYPYATQPLGEWALQTEVNFLIPRRTALGGKYGTSLKLSASWISGLQAKQNTPSGSLMGTRGPEYFFWKFGEMYFHDLSLEVGKKISRSYRFTLSYVNQGYNQKQIEGHAINGDIVNTHIAIYEGIYKLSPTVSLRNELQYLHTRQAEKDWIFGLLELSVSPYFLLTVSDQYNLGTTRQNYYHIALTGLYKAHRLMLGFGRTRKGINCSGGVCRMMPETQGMYLSYNFSF